ncbi:MAG TPA: carboxypeptidase-like regulatory domain-containing protein [Gemmatimonadaceae bacterium]|nr:carboxypeptidase-like regulatory domain-containing protein [Gemmatimonadaceae bacterium]
MRHREIVFGAMFVFSPVILPAQNPAPKTSRIIGIVVDSIHRSGLEGAEVIVSGMSSPVTTDSLGRFAIDNLTPGTYQVGVFHPLIESLGLTLASKPFGVGPDSTGVVSLAIPSVTTLASRYCGSAVTSSHPAVVAGRVLDPDTDEPVSGATISLAWTDIIVSKETGIVRTPHELHTAADSTGFFRFCGLPEDLDATVQGTRSGLSTGEVQISTSGSMLTFENLAIASSSAKSKGTVRGTVVGLDDRPVSGARVETPMWGNSVLTKEDGTFSLDQVPTGTQLIIVRHLGFEAARVNVNVTSRQPTEVRVTLGPSVNVLDPVLVTAARNYALDKNGFAARQRTGWGRYITAEQIAKRHPYQLTDMMRDLPGIRVVRGITGSTVQDERSRTILSGGRPTGACPRTYVDGFQWRIAEPGDLDLFVSPKDVIGMEVYRPNEAPLQYRGVDDNCIVILVWTR